MKTHLFWIVVCVVAVVYVQHITVVQVSEDVISSCQDRTNTQPDRGIEHQPKASRLSV